MQTTQIANICINGLASYAFFLYKFKFGVKGLSKASQGVAGMLVFGVKGILGWGVYYVNDKDFYIIVTYMEAQAVSKAINHKL